MFEGMSDDEDDFQSVSLGGTPGITLWTPLRLSSGSLTCWIWMCFRAAQQACPAEVGSLRGFVRCLWATAERPARDLLHKVNSQLLWRWPALQTAVQSLPQQPTRWGRGFSTNRWARNSTNTFNELKSWAPAAFVCSPHCLIFHSLWLRRTPLVAWPPCRPGHQSARICSVRLCSKLCRPPTFPLCRWASALKGIIAPRRSGRKDSAFYLPLLLLSGPVAVPDAAAQGHGHPGWRADAEGAAGHRRRHPGRPGAHFCWWPWTLNPDSAEETFCKGRHACIFLVSTSSNNFLYFTIKVTKL